MLLPLLYLPVYCESVQLGGGLQQVVRLQRPVNHHHLGQVGSQQLRTCRSITSKTLYEPDIEFAGDPPNLETGYRISG